MYVLLVRQGTKYGPEYPRMLKRQIKETSGLDTLILGDQDDADIQLEYRWPGWFSKLELFRPDLDKPFIYIDLDSYVLGDISEVTTDFRLIAREWHPNVQDCGRGQSSFMCLNETQDIWEKWKERPGSWMREFRGDQKFLEKFEWDYVQDFYPDLIGSYKFHNREIPVHRIVTFHGKPKPHIADGWAGEIWEKSRIVQ